MSLSLFSLLGARRRTTPSARRTRPHSYFRPALEGLEQREVMSSPASVAAPALGAALAAPAQTGSFAQALLQRLNLQITSVALNQAGNGLVANLSILNGLR